MTIYIHPTVMSPQHITRLQQQTGRTAVVCTNHIKLVDKKKPGAAKSAARTQTQTPESYWPTGGDAA